MSHPNLSNSDPSLSSISSIDQESQEPQDLQESTTDHDPNSPDDQINEESLTDVEIDVERLEGRQRQITASIVIPTAPDPIWQILTNYDQLADRIPNLAESCIVGEEGGCKLVKQVGQRKLLGLNFSATVILKIEEDFPRQLRFTLIEGDFKLFNGSWNLDPLAPPPSDPPETQLTYRLIVLPPRRMPIGLVERSLRHDLSLNLTALRDQAVTQS